MNTNKILTGAIIFGLTLQSATAAYTEVNCDTNSAFTENSCKQCFDGGEKGEGEAFGFLSDIFSNKTGNSKLIYKEEQTMPNMVNLGGDKSTWSQTPSSEDFWEYTTDFDALYSKEQEAYVVPAGTDVKWLQSKMGYAYKLDKNTVPKGENVGLLVYTVASHDLVNGEVSVDTAEHKECVLFKSGSPSIVQTPTVVEKQEVKKLPQTGPEHIVLFALSLLLALGLFGLKRKNV
nr:LPXTG cell wall anchor domain-containing protein [Candidatus Gracilibacteria bacterium]